MAEYIPERLLSTGAVAEILSLSKRQVSRMRSAGLICPSILVGVGTVRWRRSDIEKWISWDCPTLKVWLQLCNLQREKRGKDAVH